MVEDTRADLRRRLCDVLKRLLAIAGGDTTQAVPTMFSYSRPDMTAQYTNHLTEKAADAAGQLR